MAKLRWPDGFVCPKCGNRDYWRTGAGLWMCKGCSRRTSVTAGTIFARTRTPLRTWFAAVWFVTSQKNGVSALGLQRVLGMRSYETAWAWMHKLRRAMVRPDREMLSDIEDWVYPNEIAQPPDKWGRRVIRVVDRNGERFIVCGKSRGYSRQRISQRFGVGSKTAA